MRGAEGQATWLLDACLVLLSCGFPLRCVGDCLREGAITSCRTDTQTCTHLCFKGGEGAGGRR